MATMVKRLSQRPVEPLWRVRVPLVAPLCNRIITMKLYYLAAFMLALASAVILTPIMRKLAIRFNITDSPSVAPERKIHKNLTPLLGGAAISLSFLSVLAVFYFGTDIFARTSMEPRIFAGIVAATLIILVGGVLDDKFNLKPWQQLCFSITAVAVIILAGIGIRFITNPLGGVFRLDQWLMNFWGQELFVASALFTGLWLLGIMHATKFLDGLDGLVSGISIISGIALFVLSYKIRLPEAALMSAIFVGAQLGFILFNFHPASIFLGESGALFSGFMLAILAILGSGKVATAFLVLGVAILDMLWIVFRRILVDKKSPFQGDRKHLHHRLLDAGFTQTQAVLFFYGVSALFGLLALFLQSMGKLIAIIGLVGFMAILGGILVLKFKKI